MKSFKQIYNESVRRREPRAGLHEIIEYSKDGEHFCITNVKTNSYRYYKWLEDGSYSFDRVDGPAEHFPGIRTSYWRDGKLHRLDGPAFIHHDKVGPPEYWIRGVRYDPAEFKAITQKFESGDRDKAFDALGI